MADFIGTEGDDVLPFVDNAANRFFGLAGDDTMQGGSGIDRFFGGPGLDQAAGGDGADIYHYGSFSGSLFINEFESVSATQNRSDQLSFFVLATPFNPTEAFSLAQVRDAFFVLTDETAPSPFGGDTSENAFIETDFGTIQIFDQYGASPGEAVGDSANGIERIRYRWSNATGTTFDVQFSIASETEVFTGVQTGDNGNDFFFGTRGDDRISGAGGFDLIFTGDGDDQAFGGSGADLFVASRGTNDLRGESGSDFYYWNAAYRATNTILEDTNSDGDMIDAGFGIAGLFDAREAGAGDDLLLQLARAGNPERVASSFRVLGQMADGDAFEGLEFLRFGGVNYATQRAFDADGTDRNDFIAARNGRRADYRTGDGQDAVFAGEGRDDVRGQGDADFLDGGGGRDTLRGGGGDDTLRGGDGRDTVDGSGGFDVADYRSTDAAVKIDLKQGTAEGGDARGDTLRRIEGATGGSFDDRLAGDASSNALSGLWGEDVLRGRGGSDTLDGGARNDRLFGDGGSDTLVGGGGDDKAEGGAGRDLIEGGAGDDTLKGGGGGDRIVGGEGDDRLLGNGGRDVFVFAPNGGRDEIRRFQDGSDDIEIGGPTDSFDALTIRQRGADVRIDYEGGRIILRNFDEDELSAADFTFV